jgi:hypothetical protein
MRLRLAAALTIALLPLFPSLVSASESDAGMPPPIFYCPKLVQDLQRADCDVGVASPSCTRHIASGQIVELQNFLISYYPESTRLAATGRFLTETRNAVIQFQLDERIIPTRADGGRVGPLTRARIAALACARGTTAARCAPLPSETQTLPCPAGQTGTITQTRTSVCSAGATSPLWSAWATTQNTCAAAAQTTYTAPTGVQVGFNELFFTGYAQTQGLPAIGGNSPAIAGATIDAYLDALAKGGVHTLRDIVDLTTIANSSFYPHGAAVMKKLQDRNFTLIFAAGSRNPFAPAGSTYNCWIPSTDAAWSTQSAQMTGAVADFFGYLKTRPEISQDWLRSHVLVEPWNEFDSVGTMAGGSCAPRMGTPKSAASLYKAYLSAFASKNISLEIVAPSQSGVYWGWMSDQGKALPIFAGWLNDYYAQGGGGRPNVHIYYSTQGPLDGESVSNFVVKTFNNMYQGVPPQWTARGILGEHGATVRDDGGCAAADAMTDAAKATDYTKIINGLRNRASVIAFWRLLSIADSPPCHYGSVPASAGLGAAGLFNASGNAVFQAI